MAWVYLQPALERCIEFRADWILQMFARNLALMILIAGSLHLYLHTFRKQSADRKYDARELGKNDRRDLGRNPVRDNIFWSCASGVTVWTAYEVFFMWAYANNLLPFYLDWASHPIWFALPFAAIVFWSSFHFYFVHRCLHWKPLYKIAHTVHRRFYNCNFGNEYTPCDRWFGTYNDGPAESLARVRKRSSMKRLLNTP